jgi:hypothetical protein
MFVSSLGKRFLVPREEHEGRRLCRADVKNVRSLIVINAANEETWFREMQYQ